MTRMKRWLAGLGMAGLMLTLGFAFAACGGSNAGSAVADIDQDAAEHVEDVVSADSDEATHLEDEGLADGDEALHEDDEALHEDDEATHEEGDEHEADEHDANGDGGGEAFAYLEVAPKDALYLVKMTNFAFTPNVLEVNAGDVLEIAIQNVEPVLHDFTIDEIGADVHISYLGGTGQHLHAEPERDADVHFALTEPGSGVVHLRVYEPGEYVIYCTVPGHREAGMEGTLIVQ